MISQMRFVGYRSLTTFYLAKSWTPSNYLLPILGKCTFPSNTNYSKRDFSKLHLPQLMKFPEILWPSALKVVRNWIIIHFMIRPYFDKDFSISEFVFGARRAIQVISTKLVQSDFAALKDFVTPEALIELKSNLQKLSVSERRQLQVKEDDIYLAFPYQVDVIINETNGKIQKRSVEITTVFHVLSGLNEMRKQGEDIPWNVGVLPQYQDKIFVCNYRFIKEFTKESQSDWIVNIVNHFKPIDLIKNN